MADLEFIASVPPGGDENPPIGKDILQIPPGSGEAPTDDTIKKDLQEIGQWEKITQESTDSVPDLGKETVPSPGTPKPSPIDDPTAEWWTDWIPIEGTKGKNNFLEWTKQPGSADQQKNPKNYWWVTYIEAYTTSVFEALVITPPLFDFPVVSFFNYINSNTALRNATIKNTREGNPGFGNNWPPILSDFTGASEVFYYRPIDWIKVTNAQAEVLAHVNDIKPDVTTVIWAPIDMITLNN